MRKLLHPFQKEGRGGFKAAANSEYAILCIFTMKKKTVSIEELAKYSDQYIILSSDRTRIFAGAKTIKELDKKTEKMKIKGGILHYVPPIDRVLTLPCQ